jgi:predicted DNA-binding protein
MSQSFRVMEGSTMKKLMIYVEEEMHEDLRLLAFRKRTTMAALIRYAVDKTFEDELDAIVAEKALDEYAANPEAAVTLEEYMQRRGIAIQSGTEPARRTRLRRVAEERGRPYRTGPGGSEK